MSTVSVTIRGEYIDGFVYMDHLYAWSRGGNLVAWSCARLADALVHQAGWRPSRAGWLVMNNRWTPQRSSGDAESREATISLDPEFTLSTGRRSATVHDLLVTYGELFASTSIGLLRCSVRAIQQTRSEVELERRHDGSVLGAVAKFGGVALAAGPDGAWALINEFGFDERRETSRVQFSAHPTADVGFIGETLFVEYRGEEERLDYFRPEIESSRPSRRKEAIRLAVGVDAIEHSSVYGELMLGEGDGAGAVHPLRGAVARVVDGDLWMAKAGRWDGIFGTHSSPAVVARGVSGLWDVLETDSAVVMELEGRVVAVHRGMYAVIREGSAITTRTFLDSKRFRLLVLTTTGGGLSLTLIDGVHPLGEHRRDELYGEPSGHLERWRGLTAKQLAPAGTVPG